MLPGIRLGLSRRDFAMVAWHEMPGKRTPGAPSRRDGMIKRRQQFIRTCALFCAFPLHFVEGLAEIGSQIFHVFDADR